MRKEGFTLIELIIVIVILGILAAVAVPKFAGFTKEAKRSAVKGFAGSLRAAMHIAHGRWLILDNVSRDNVTMDGNTVYMCYKDGINTSGTNCKNDALAGYPEPTTRGIGAAVSYDNNTFIPTQGNYEITFHYKGFPNDSDGCYVKYDYSQSGKGPVVIDNYTGCE